MTGTKAVLDLLVVARACIRVLNENADGRAGRDTLKHTRQDSDLVALTALTHEVRRPRPAPIDIRLQVGFRERHARRTAVDDAAHSRAVALAKRRDCEQLAYGVTGHASLTHLLGRQQKNPAAAPLKIQPDERQVPAGAAIFGFHIAHLDDEEAPR